MRFHTTAVLSAMILGGCTPAATTVQDATQAGGTGLWSVLFEDPEGEGGDTVCTENWNDSSCDDGEFNDTGGSSDWVYDADYSASRNGSQIAVLGGGGDVMFLVIGDVLVEGVRTEGGFRFEAMGTAEEFTSSAHPPAGYSFTRRSESSSKTTITLNIGADGATLTGTVRTEFSSEATFTESDEWDDDESGNYYGDIQNYVYSYLETRDTDVTNYADDDTCSGSSCELKRTTSGVQTQAFKGTWIQTDVEAAGDLVQNRTTRGQYWVPTF